MKFKDLDLDKSFRRESWLETYPSWVHRKGLNFPINDSEQNVYMGYMDAIGEDWINTEELTELRLQILEEIADADQQMGLYDESEQSND